MSSLRTGLTFWLWSTLAVVGTVSAAAGILGARWETLGQVDYQMQQVARIIASQPVAAKQGIAGSNSQLLPLVYVHHDSDDDLIVTVRDQQGKLLYASPTNRHLAGGVLPALRQLGFQTAKIGDQPFRVFVARSGKLSIQVAQSMEAIGEAEQQMALASLLPIGLLLPILAIVIGWAIRRQLLPLTRATQVIAGRPPLSLEALPVDGMPAEVRPLVHEINRLLGRLGTAVELEQRFVTDAAHALRTPLTALQLQAEVLEGGKTAEERAARLGELRAGIKRTIRLSEQLLSLARSQSESGPITVTTDLGLALQETCALYCAAARSKGIELCIEASCSARVHGNARRLTLIFGNLLDNAICFTPRGGQVRIRACAAGEAVQVDIRDEGCGLPPGELERVFDRFYQVPGSEGHGGGLGLSTVQALVRQLGGRVSLANRVDGAGLVATVMLPLADGPVSPCHPPGADPPDGPRSSAAGSGAELATAPL